MKTFTASSKTLLSNAALGVVGVALVSTMVVRASSAAFTGSTSNDANTWDAGTVTLTDNDAGAAMFKAANLRPGDTAKKCVEVTYTGSLTPAEAIKIHGVIDSGTSPAASATLSDDLDIVLNIYAATQTCATANPTPSPVYSGTLAGLPSGYATGSTTAWTPAGGASEVRAFELTYTLGTDTSNDAQGDGATANFVWEATS